MKKVTLGKISLILTRGKAPLYDETGSGRIVKSAQVQPKAILWDKCPNVSDAFAQKFKKNFALRNDDILLNGTGTGTLGRPGFVIKVPHGIYVPDSHVNLIRIDESQAFPKFVFHWLNSPTCQKKIALASTGSTNQIELSAERLSKISVPLPPLAEQIHIAQVLDQADRLRQQDRQLLAHYDQLVQAVFMDMFGDPVRNEKGWKKEKLVDIASISSGVTKGRQLDPSEVIELPYMRVANVQDGHLNLSEIKTIPIRRNELEKFSLQKGDILLTEGGDPDKLGRGAVWNGEIAPCLHQNHIFKVRPKSIANAVFLSALIGSPYGKKFFLKAAKQTTGIATINSTQLKQFPALVPPLELQEKYAVAVNAIEAQKAATQQLQAQSETLFNSLLQQAFRGELTQPKPAAAPVAGQLAFALE